MTGELRECPMAVFPWLPEHRLRIADMLQNSRGGASEFAAGCADCDIYTDQHRTREEAIAAWNTRTIPAHPSSDDPIPMVLFCPKCGQQHIDAPDERTPDWTNPPHRSHLCHGCGCIWRPADVPTEGVIATQTRGSKDTIFYNAAARAALEEQTPGTPRSSDDGEVERLLTAILEVAPSLPKQYQWSGQAEALFDNGLRHKSGKKPFDYLKSWLSMLRPFAYATQDDSWGEMEKLLCIVMRNYARVAAAADAARAAIAAQVTK